MSDQNAPVWVSREVEEKIVAEIGLFSTTDIQQTRRDVEGLGLDPKDFAHDDTRGVFELQLQSLRAQEPCSIVHIEKEARRRNLTIGWLILRQAEAGSFDFVLKPYAREIQELAARRRIRALGVDMMARAADPMKPTAETVSQLGSALNQLVSGADAVMQPLNTKMGVVIAEMERLRVGTEEAVLKTGIDAWDRNVGGLWPTLTVIGGHPSQGKSGLIASMMLSLCRRGVKGAVFSLEDKAEWILYRWLGHFSRVSQFIIRTRQLTQTQEEQVADQLALVDQLSSLILYDDRSRLTTGQISAAAREAVLNRGAKYIIIDHKEELALGGGDDKRHDLEVAEALYELRALAKDFNVPVVLLSQLSRSKRPPHTMQDFKNASSVEEAARVAAIVWSPDGAVGEQKRTVSVVKMTNGKNIFDLDFELCPFSGLLLEPSPKMEKTDPSKLQETLL